METFRHERRTVTALFADLAGSTAEDAAVIPLTHQRNISHIKPWVHGWWEYGKAWSSFADLPVDERSPRYQSQPDD